MLRQRLGDISSKLFGVVPVLNLPRTAAPIHPSWVLEQLETQSSQLEARRRSIWATLLKLQFASYRYKGDIPCDSLANLGNYLCDKFAELDLLAIKATPESLKTFQTTTPACLARWLSLRSNQLLYSPNETGAKTVLPLSMRLIAGDVVSHEGIDFIRLTALLSLKAKEENSEGVQFNVVFELPKIRQPQLRIVWVHPHTQA